MERLLLILDCLARNDDLTLADLTRETKLPKSTLHRRLSALVASGAVTRDDRSYRLSDELVNVIDSRSNARKTDLRRLLMPYLVDLLMKTGHVAGAATLDLPDVYFIETVYDHRYSRVMRHLPDRVPAHRTAAGKVLLAFQDDELHHYRTIRALSGHTAKDPSPLTRELTASRDAGVAVGRGELLMGMRDVAAAVTERDGHPVAALTVAGAMTNFELARAGQHLRVIAHAASLAIRNRAADQKRNAYTPSMALRRLA